MNPEFLNLFMKKETRDRVVPTIDMRNLRMESSRF
jgi:hypothetical protein